MAVALGVCFGKAAIIRPRAPPRDDKLQSIECDTRHSGDERRLASKRMNIDTVRIHTHKLDS